MLDGDLIRIFNRRTMLIGMGKLGLIFVLFARLFSLQILGAKKYKKLSDRNSLRVRFLIPPRGMMLDRNQKVLADNVEKYNAYFIAEEAIQHPNITLDDVLNLLTKKLDLKEKDLKRIDRDIKKQRKFLPVLIKSNLSWEKMGELEAGNLDMPGVFVEQVLERYYPYKQVASHTLGYVGMADLEDLPESDTILEKLPNFRIGKSGLEKKYDMELRGHPGELYQVVNSVGRVVETFEEDKTTSIPGRDLHLTIDAELQKYTSEIIDEKSAGVVVMNIHNGDVLAMTSVPEYDLGLFEGGIQKEVYRELSQSVYKPFMNKPVEGTYPPGSTFKMIVALAGLESGVITPYTRVKCPGHFTHGGHKYHCWQKNGHGSVDLVEALQKSCDVFFYELALKVGIENINTMAKKFGLGEKTGIELFGEKEGLIPSRRWKKKTFGEPWYHGNTILTSIGQGYTLTTPLQLAVMTARIANGGKAVTPHIVKTAGGKSDFASMNIDPKNLAVIQKGMFDVVNKKNGTAYWTRFIQNGNRMAGKTGTSQVRRITQKERLEGRKKEEEFEWKQRHHALFVGYAPADNPKYAVSVIVEHGRGGSVTAAPIASKVLRKVLELYGDD